jgi:hypothetical protein
MSAIHENVRRWKLRTACSFAVRLSQEARRSALRGFGATKPRVSRMTLRIFVRRITSSVGQIIMSSVDIPRDGEPNTSTQLCGWRRAISTS